MEKERVENSEEDGSKYLDATMKLANRHLLTLDEDILYHLDLGTKSHDLQKMFGDVKFVCLGGTPARMKNFAIYLMDVLNYQIPIGTTLSELTNYRFSMYKVGPVLSISHGMGTSSIGILLHEVIKLLYYAKVKDPVLFRLGTSGGIGQKGGTVVISDKAVDAYGNNFHEVAVLGEAIRRPVVFNEQLIKDLKSCIDKNESYDTITGTTMCAQDFYEGQGRLDGAICDYTEEDKMNYLAKLQKEGVVNIEMEATVLAAVTHHIGIRAAVVCVTFLDRLQGDQVTATKEEMEEWQLRPFKLVATYIKRSLQGNL